MIVIDKDKYRLYRYAIAKMVYIIMNPNIKFVKNINSSNCFIANINGENCLVSLFGKPYGVSCTAEFDKLNYKKVVIRSEEMKSIISYFQGQEQADYNKSGLEGQLLIAPDSARKNIDTSIFDDIMEGITIDKPSDERLYKYSNVTSREKDPFNKLQGVISFVPPEKLNDPFDSLYYVNNRNQSNIFKIFCTTGESKDIIMWSYYGYGHKGCCLEYSKLDIIQQLTDLKMDGFCICGNVKYSVKRPKYRFNSKELTYSMLKKYIDCVFTKAQQWKHEKEYRFVIVSKDIKNVVSLKVPIKKIYCGCKNEAFRSSYYNGVEYVKITDDKTEYRLI